MGKFDTVTAVNISHPNCQYNVDYQTKSLDCDHKHYIIFNRQLWLQNDVGEDAIDAIPVQYDGILNIYTTHEIVDCEYWIEYDLTFSAGVLIDIEMVQETLQKDNFDKALMRPLPKSKNTCITLDFQGADDVYDKFHKTIDERLAAIRTAVGDQNAEIVYPIEDKTQGLFGSTFPEIWIHSIVQNMSDFDIKDPEKLEGNRSNNLSMDESYRLR